MSNIEVQTHFDLLCRLCTYQCSQIDVLSIFSQEGKMREVRYKIQECLSLSVQEVDKLPKAICQSCLYKLDLLFDFRKKCFESEHYLMDLLKRTTESPIFFVHNNLQHYDNTTFSNISLSETIHIDNVTDSVLDAHHNPQLLDNITIDNVYSLKETDFNSFTTSDSNQLNFNEDDIKTIEENAKQLQLALQKEYIDINEVQYSDFQSQDDEFDFDADKLVNDDEAVNSGQEILDFDIDGHFDEKLTEVTNEIFMPKKVSIKKPSNKVCKICSKSFKTNFKLSEHLRTHTNEKPFKCSYENCSKKFKSKLGLVEHEAKHTGKFEYSCGTCAKGFNSKSYLELHQRVHSKSKQFKCNTCGTYLKSKAALVDHENRHLGVRPFSCTRCDKKFTTKSSLEKHESIHSGNVERIYPCTICNKKFVSKYYLTTHVRIHTNDRKFICDACGKAFLTAVDLKLHAPIHTGVKKYVCEACGKAFIRRDTLISHRRVHTDEKPYECKYCKQTFSQYTPMVVHIRTHTGERPYVCKSCPKSFICKSSLVGHIKRQHNLDDNVEEI